MADATDVREKVTRKLNGALNGTWCRGSGDIREDYQHDISEEGFLHGGIETSLEGAEECDLDKVGQGLAVVNDSILTIVSDFYALSEQCKIKWTKDGLSTYHPDAESWWHPTVKDLAERWSGKENIFARGEEIEDMTAAIGGTTLPAVGDHLDELNQAISRSMRLIEREVLDELEDNCNIEET